LDCFNDRNENGRSLLGMALNSKSDTLIEKVLKFLSNNCDNNYIDFAGELWKVKVEKIINLLADENHLLVELMEVMVFNHNHDLRSKLGTCCESLHKVHLLQQTGKNHCPRIDQCRSDIQGPFFLTWTEELQRSHETSISPTCL